MKKPFDFENFTLVAGFLQEIEFAATNAASSLKDPAAESRVPKEFFVENLEEINTQLWMMLQSLGNICGSMEQFGNYKKDMETD